MKEKEAKIVERSDEELTLVNGGNGSFPGEVSGDTEARTFSGKVVPMPPADSKKPIGSKGEISAFCLNCQKMQTFEKSAQVYRCVECGFTL